MKALSPGLWIVLILAGALSYVPLVPIFPTPDSEAGWMLALNTAVAQGRVFGRDIVFTFGPWAAVQTAQFHPATARMMLGGSAFVALALAGGLVVLTDRARRWRAAVAANILLLIWARDALGIVLPLVALLVAGEAALRPRRSTRAALMLLMPALALLCLVKESYAAGAVIALLFGLPLLLLSGRTGLAVLGVFLFLATMALFWVLAGQPLAALPGFVRAAAPIVAGYGQAMALPTPPNQPVICGLAMVAVTTVLHVGHARRLGAGGRLLTLGAALVLALGFKAGFVRGDPGHVVIATGTLLLAAAIIAAVVPLRLAVLTWAIGVAAWGAIGMQIPPLPPAELALRIPQGWLAGTLLSPAILKHRYDASLADIRARFPLPAIAGPVDIYAYGQVMLLAAGLDWDPRPVVQSYSAYTTGLAARDRAHLLGPAAPQTILFRIEPIDGRLPALEDGLSWPALLSRYAVTSQLFGGEMAVLSRRTPAEVITGPPVPAGRHKLGTTIALPAGDDLVWAEIDLRPTVLGRLVDAAYKLSPPTITLTCEGHHVATFRYVPEMGRGGFLISPLVRSTADFVAVSTQTAGPCHPVAMRIDAESLVWSKRFSLRLNRIKITPK